MVFEFNGVNVQGRIKSMEPVDLSAVKGAPQAAAPAAIMRGVLDKSAEVLFVKAADSNLKLKGSARSTTANPIIQPNFKFEDLGIGGLDNEFNTIFRRAFASRIYPQQLIQQLGIKHVKGTAAAERTDGIVRPLTQTCRRLQACCCTAHRAPARRSWRARLARCSIPASPRS